jgi:murein DD-endopeptidase MepM/ murein hydrolase activator NlpD
VRLWALLFCVACAAPAPKEEPPIPVAIRPQVTREVQPVRYPRDPELATEVDLRVVQFAAERRHISESQVVSARKRFWPERMRSAWSGLLLYLDDALDRAPGDFPSPLLLRTNIALEAELDLTTGQYGPMPEFIHGAYDRVRKHVRRHLRSPDSPSIEKRAPMAFHWPLNPPLVTSKFGDRQDPILDEGAIRFHGGVDLAGVTGDLVGAAAPGRVQFAGWLAGTGNTVIVRHPQGWVSFYGHLAELLVAARAHVATGTPVGMVGSTGRSTGPHLHFELRKNGVHVDPETIIRKNRPGEPPH